MALTLTTAPTQPTTPPCGARLDVVAVNQHIKDRQTLHDVSFSVEPGEVVAIVGGSGAGKTTLLEALVGVRPASSGTVRVDEIDITGVDPSGSGVGYVPQDDIIHRDLALGRTITHAAKLRLPAETNPETLERIVDETMSRLDLLDRRDVRVGSLSGGQRKRASIAVEMLTRPRLFFLDEPTSGLDPATGREFMRQLHKLAGTGTTIVLTTHNPDDIDLADRVVFLARDGYVAFVGTPAEAHTYFGVDHLVRAYDRLASEDTSEIWAARFSTSEYASTSSAPRDDRATSCDPDAIDAHQARVGPMRQWLALSRRNAELMVKNKLTLALLIGAPVMVISMMAVLFRTGSFEPGQPSAMPAVQTLFWVAFAGFFFGVTYGLLQVVSEVSIFRRERLAGLGAGAYVASKVTVLTPLLIVSSAALLAIFRALDRLPAAPISVWIELLITIVLVSLAALTLGLLTSAAVNDTVQAFAAYPMLCFPQALFAGAIVAVPEMTVVGRGMSFGLANRWAFESLGRSMGLDTLIEGDAATAGYESAFTGSAVEGWLILIGMSIALSVGTVAVLRAKTRPARR